MNGKEFNQWLDENYSSMYDQYVQIWAPRYDDPNQVNTDDFEKWMRHVYSYSQRECSFCGSTDIILVEYCYGCKDYYDGISEARCNDCSRRYGRWSGQELTGDETESPFGL